MSIWLLFKKADESGVAIPLYPPEPSFGKRNIDIQRIKIRVPPNDDELQSLVTVGVEQANSLMFKEDLCRRLGSIRFNLKNIPSNIIGSSADLAFALATIAETLPIENGYPPFAATGVLDENGFVNKVGGISAKLHAGLLAIEPGSIIFFPDANKFDITVKLKKLAEKKLIELCPVKRLDEAVSKLGHSISKVEPYLGLKPYTYEHRNRYYGREQETIEICNRLKKNADEGTPGLIIVAESGAGKSSLVQAGILPALVQSGFNEEKNDSSKIKNQSIIWAVTRPTEFGDLSEEAESCEVIRHAWINQCSPELLDLPMVESWEQLGETLTNVLSEKYRFVWVLDQLEELFTLEQFEEILKNGSLDRFIKFLSLLQDNGIWIIATLRNDYFSQYQGLPNLLTIFKDKQYDLLNGQSAMLAKIINQPAESANLIFGYEDNDNTDNKKQIQLNDQIFEDMKGSTLGLPFLSLTLQQLFEKREKNRLTFNAYKDIGGLDGAINKFTKNTVSSLKTRKKKSVSENQLLDVLEKLVGLNASGDKKFRVSFPLELFSEEEKFIVRQLIDARLLTTKQENNQTIVELALDCLLKEWPEVESAIKRREEEFKRRQGLIGDAKTWNANGQDKALLLKSYEKVIEAELQLYHEGHFFSPITESYVENSMLKTRKQYRGLWIIFCIIIIYFCFKEIVSFHQNNIEGIIPTTIMYFLYSTPYVVWLFRTFKKKPYILTFKKEKYINLVLFFVTAIIAILYFLMMWEQQGNSFLSLYSEELAISSIHFIVPIVIFRHYIVNLKIKHDLTNKNDFVEKKSLKHRFFLKRLNISSHIMLGLNILLAFGFIYGNYAEKHPADLLLFSYARYLSSASYHIKNDNLKTAEELLKKAKNNFNIIPDDVIGYDLFSDRLYHFRLSEKLSRKKFLYSESKKNIKDCIKTGQEFLEKNQVQEKWRWLNFNPAIELLERLKKKNKIKFSRAINQYALCVAEAANWYWEDSSKGVLSYEKSINLFEKAKKIAPNDGSYFGNLISAYIGLGDLHLKHKQEKLAMEAYKTAEDLLHTNLKQFDDIGLVYIKKKSISLYRAKARFYKEKGSFQQAEDYLKKALDLSQKLYKNESEKLESSMLLEEIKIEIEKNGLRPALSPNVVDLSSLPTNTTIKIPTIP